MKKVLPIITALLMLLCSCGVTDETANNITVYTSFYAMNDFVRTIGGTDIVYHSIVPAGTEPHGFEPTASDMAKLSKADVFVYNGGGIDAWAEKVADTLPDSVTVVCTSDGIEADENDPHIWLSLENAEKQMEMIYKALSTADSENSQAYLDRMLEYCAEIDALEKEYENAGLSGRKLFVTHSAYGYLCAEFGMEQIALESVSGDPSPAQMAKIVGQIKADGAECIFFDPLDGDKIANVAAQEAGIEALPLYTFESDSEHRDYVTVMRENLNQLKKAFN